MPNAAHREAEDLASRAESLMKRGLEEEATALYIQAADSEYAALSQVTFDNPRTRGILAVSHVSLLFKARLYREAISASKDLLSQEDVPPFAKSQIEEILAESESFNEIPRSVESDPKNFETLEPKSQQFLGLAGASEWSNPSVLLLAQGADPLSEVLDRALEVVIDAVEKGWSGPPFDVFELARLRSINVVPKHDVLDARTISAGAHSCTIEYNPSKNPARIRYSVAHEIAHTLFPDFREQVRNRAKFRHRATERDDEWQLELLCNLAAAEFLMPTAVDNDLESAPLEINSLLGLQTRYEVSVETLLLRIVEVSSAPSLMFAAHRMNEDSDEPKYRIDYTSPSRVWPFPDSSISTGTLISGNSALSECTAVGWTADRKQRLSPQRPELRVQCVGIPPYPGHRYPRVAGILTDTEAKSVGQWINVFWGDATEPRGTGKRLIAHVVNDATPRWGGTGFARDVRRKWPFVQQEFIQWESENKNLFRLGSIHLVDIHEQLAIANMIAQRGYGPARRPRIRYAALKECLIQVSRVAQMQGYSVHMPRIGAGQAGGNWAVIRQLIDDTLCRQGVEVTVYELPYSPIGRVEQGAFNI